MDEYQYVHDMAREAAARARVGDWGPLIRFLESDHLPVTKDLREVLTLIVQGDLKRSNNRPPKSATAEQQYQMAVAVDILKECKVATESAVAEVAARYKVSTGTVYRAMREQRSAVAKLHEYDDCAYG